MSVARPSMGKCPLSPSLSRMTPHSFSRFCSLLRTLLIFVLVKIFGNKYQKPAHMNKRYLRKDLLQGLRGFPHNPSERTQPDSGSTCPGELSGTQTSLLLSASLWPSAPCYPTSEKSLPLQLSPHAEYGQPLLPVIHTIGLVPSNSQSFRVAISNSCSGVPKQLTLSQRASPVLVDLSMEVGPPWLLSTHFFPFGHSVPIAGS